jgi:MSHA biogenesis protein MshN
MSVINQMLQDLDRRSAMAGGEAPYVAHHLKVVDPGHKGREWFWRLVAALLLAALAWVGWVAYQLQPRTLATERAFRAADQARSGPIVAVAVAAAAPAPAPAPAAPAAPVPEMKPVVQEAKPPEPAERKRSPAKAVTKPLKEVQGTVSKREITKTAGDVADAHFRRAAQFLNQGRVSEAEAQLALALKADAAHVPARQAYVALLLELRRVADARDLLREAAVAVNPAHAPFTLALARIHAEQQDYAGALGVIDSAGTAAQGAEFQSLRAVVLQRLGRHAEAAAAYQQALRSGPQHAATWMGLAISLEALGHRAEAAQAYRRALGAGALAGEAKEYAEARVKALD